MEATASLLYADPRWMLAVTPDGLIGVGPEVDIRVEFEASLEAKRGLLDTLFAGITPDGVSDLTGAEPQESEALLEQLAEPGALVQGAAAPPPDGAALIDALLGLDKTGELPPLIWTADEALLVPPALERRQRRRLLRSFIAGIRPAGRRIAYCHAARWLRRTVRGDVPAPGQLERMLADRSPDPSAIHVLDLRDGGRTSLTPDELDDLGAHDTHRLGPVIGLIELSTQGERLGASMFAAEYATPNLAHPEDGGLKSLGRGIAPSPELAETIARAEAVERYAAGELSGREFVRAREKDLPGAVPGDSLLRLNRRQYAETELFEPYKPEAEYLWTPARANDGSRRWVLAELVYFPFVDPARERSFALVSSSGVAAHYDLAEAARRAFCELVERDAFMWTWVQRVSRERIDPGSLPDGMGDPIGRMNRRGHQVELVNLTLETHPVIFCAIHDEATLSIAAACDPDPATAAEKCLREAMSHALGTEGPPIEPQEVENPADHAQLYRSAERVEHASFAFSSSEEIELGDVAVTREPIEQLLEQFGEPLAVDLSCAGSSPLHVVRALVPGTIPISFGCDREPLAIPLLSRPRTTLDGRRLGAELDLTTAGPLLPHPFA